MTAAAIRAALASKPLARFSERCPAPLRGLAKRVDAFALGRYVVWAVSSVMLAAKYRVSYGAILAAVAVVVEWFFFPAKRLGAAHATASSSPTAAVAGAPSRKAPVANSAPSATPAVSASGPEPIALPPGVAPTAVPVPVAAPGPGPAAAAPRPTRKPHANPDVEAYWSAIESGNLAAIQSAISDEKAAKLLAVSKTKKTQVFGRAVELAAERNDDAVLRFVTQQMAKWLEVLDGHVSRILEYARLTEFLASSQKKAQLIVYILVDQKPPLYSRFLQCSFIDKTSLLRQVCEMPQERIDKKITQNLTDTLFEAVNDGDQRLTEMLLNSGKCTKDAIKKWLSFEAFAILYSNWKPFHKKGDEFPEPSDADRARVIQATPKLKRLQDHLDALPEPAST